MNWTLFFVAIFILGFFGMIIAIIVTMKAKAAENAVNKEKQVQRAREQQEFNDWWVKSKFNEFEVVKNYTTLLAKENRYRQVLKQVATGKYYDRETTVDNYYKFQEGTIINFIYVQDDISKQDGSRQTYNKNPLEGLTNEELIRRAEEIGFEEAQKELDRRGYFKKKEKEDILSFKR